MRPFFLTSLVLILCSATLVAETLYAKWKSNAVREGAGSYYSLVGSVAENTALVVVSRTGPWVKVQLPDRQVGWIAASSLKAENPGKDVPPPPEAMWSTPKALSAAIKGFGKKFVEGDPGIVDSVLALTEKGFTSDELAAFSAGIRSQRSSNRDRLQIEDLGLPTPEYHVDLPERQIGVGIAARIAGRGMVNSRPLHRYVNMVCATIAGQSAVYDADLTVLVLDDTTMNAFAVPGGYIFITLGLLTRCSDESELAGIIAHEVAHVFRRHGLQELSRRYAAVRADMAFAELEADVGDATEDEAEMEDLVDRSYERIVHPRLLSYEVEADRIGAVFAANAGYDPFGLVRISERVARASAETTGLFDPDYMLPDDAAQRARDIRSFAEKHFAADQPGGQMSSRFTSVVEMLR
jgi:hypothetical protein